MSEAALLDELVVPITVAYLEEDGVYQVRGTFLANVEEEETGL